MALVKQTLTLTLFFISAQIISTIHVGARSAPWPATGTPPPAATEDAEEADTKPNSFDLLPLPDIIPDETGGTDADIAKMVTKQMQAIEKKINDFNTSLKARLENPNASHGTKECVTECDEVFGAAVDDIQNTLDSLDSLNLMKANFDVSAVATNVDTCNDCFKEMLGGDPDVEKFSKWVTSITGEALEALQKSNN